MKDLFSSMDSIRRFDWASSLADMEACRALKTATLRDSQSLLMIIR